VDAAQGELERSMTMMWSVEYKARKSPIQYWCQYMTCQTLDYAIHLADQLHPHVEECRIRDNYANFVIDYNGRHNNGQH